MKDKKNGKMKCNMENVRKGHIIPSIKINIGNLNSKYHTARDHTKRHIKIHTMKIIPYHCSLCAKKIHLLEPHEESC